MGHVEAAKLTPARLGSYHTGCMHRVVVGLALIVTGLPVEAQARPLTLRRAERAIDLALQAELAGDLRGARKALLDLVKSSTTAESTAGRARVRRWLRGLDHRVRVWTGQSDKARMYSALIESLAPFGLSRVELVWDAALNEVPQLRTIRDQQARIAVHPDRIVGLDEEMNKALQKQLAATFGRHGLRIEFPDVEPRLPRPRRKQEQVPSIGTYWYRGGPEAPFELRLEVDATGRRASGPRVEVEARASYILKGVGPEGSQIGRFARRRRETRRTEEAARRFALHQVSIEIAESVVVHMWVECLRQAANSAVDDFDSASDVRSN